MQPVVFAPGWANYSAIPNAGDFYEDVRYFKDVSNVVHLQGLAWHPGEYPQPNSALASLIFTLPPGYRPQRAVIVSGTGNCDGTDGDPALGDMDAKCRVEIYPDGSVYLLDRWFPSIMSLTSISFRAQ